MENENERSTIDNISYMDQHNININEVRLENELYHIKLNLQEKPGLNKPCLTFIIIKQQ